MNKKQALRSSEKTSLWPTIGFTILLIFSLVLIGWMVVHADRELRDNMLQQTRQEAQTLNLDLIKELSGTTADPNTTAYQQLEKKISDIHLASPKCRYVYLMGRKADGKVFFFVDVKDDSKEEVPTAKPGEIYDDASTELLNIFNTKVSFVEGPLPDKWGVWVSALVPLTDPQTGAVVAVLGMDFPAHDWKWNVAAKVALPVGLVIVLLIGGLTALLATLRPSASPKPVLRRIFPALTVLLLLLIGGFVGLLVRMHHERLIEVSRQDAQEVVNGLSQLLDDQSVALSALQEALVQDANLTVALKAGDRDRLLTTYHPLLKQLHARYGVSHFYFSDTNRVCVLRVHRPEKYGDRFNRFTALEAERTGETASGIELGPLGTFTLRVVRPVFDSGGLIGYLELGKEIEDVLDVAGNVEGMEKVLLIRKNMLDRPQWEGGMRMMNRKADWDRFSDRVISYSSIPFPKEAERLIGGVQKGSGEISGEIRFDSKDWRVMTELMSDASGQRVGELLLLQDVTVLKAAHYRLKIIAGTGAVVLLTVLLGLIFVLLRRTDVSISAQQAGLRESEKRIRQLARHLETVREEEHTHFANELHDELGQILTAIKIDLAVVAAECPGEGRMKEIINETQRLLTEGVLGIHTLCREIRPGALDDLGLEGALTGLVTDWKQRNDAECDFSSDIEEEVLTDKIRTAVFRIVQEALTNVSTHAQASKVEINLVADEQALHFSVADNGRGMETGAESKPTSFGLLHMRERLEALGGEFHVESSPGKGTRIEGTIPLPRKE
jgi:hypothetical protein